MAHAKTLFVMTRYLYLFVCVIASMQIAKAQNDSLISIRRRLFSNTITFFF